MKNICFIPARGGSKGIKNKNVCLLDGLPLLYWSILAAVECDIFDCIYISSDSNYILDYVNIFEGKMGKSNVTKVFRSESCSGDKSTTESAVLEFLDSYDNICDKDVMYILQPTSPFRHNNLIAKFDTDFKKSGKDSGFTVESITPFLWKSGFPLYDINKRKMRQDLQLNEFYFHEDGNIYAFTVGHMRNSKIRLSENAYMHVSDEVQALQIDSYLELNFLNFIAHENMEVAEWKKDIVGLLPK